MYTVLQKSIVIFGGSGPTPFLSMVLGLRKMNLCALPKCSVTILPSEGVRFARDTELHTSVVECVLLNFTGADERCPS